MCSPKAGCLNLRSRTPGCRIPFVTFHQRGISSPTRGGFPPRRFMILSKALKSASAFRSARNSAICRAYSFSATAVATILIDARTVFFALLLNRLFQRARQPQRICARFRHFPILSTARNGVVTLMPNGTFRSLAR